MLDLTTPFGPPPAGAAIAIMYAFNRSTVLTPFRKASLSAYLKDMTFIYRLVLSLVSVGTKLPITLHFAGECNRVQTVPNYYINQTREFSNQTRALSNQSRALFYR